MQLNPTFTRYAVALALTACLPQAKAQSMLRPMVYTPQFAGLILTKNPEDGCKAQIRSYAGQLNYEFPPTSSAIVETYADGRMTSGALPYNTPKLGGWICKAAFTDSTGRPQLFSLKWMYPVCPDSWAPGSYAYGERFCPRQPVMSCEQVGCKEDSPFTPNPFHVLSGTRRIEEEIYAGGYEGRLKFSVTYRNLTYLEPAGMWFVSPFRGLKADGPLSLSDFVQVERGDGMSYAFEKRSDGWGGLPNYAVSFRRGAIDPPRWEFIDREDTIESFDDDGRLLETTWRDGYRQRLTYATADGVYPPDAPACASASAGVPGRPLCLTDSQGRQLHFDYDAGGRLAAMRDPANAVYTIAYDARGMIGSITWPGGLRKNYLYDEASLAPPGRNLLTGVVEMDGDIERRFASYGYDGSGKATSSAHAGEGGGYRAVGPWSAGVTLVDPLGKKRTYYFAFINGMPQVTLVIHQLANGTAVGRTEVAYDGAGNPAARTDANGIRTVFNQDARGRELLRIEAADTPQERRFTTEWHARLRQPLRVAAPLRITTYTYDDGGRLLARREQATTDVNGKLGFNAVADGAPRTWTYSYTADGQLASEQEPGGAVTSHEYDAQGNRIASINALGHRTAFLDYDANGRVHRIVDPNGAVQRLDYHPRGWLLSRDVEGEVTRYDYFPSGLLRSVRLPDGGGLDYSYDEGRRLVAVTDTSGNRLAYRLDAAGNRLAEEVFDAQGALSRRITRVFDDLGRLVESVGQ